MTIEDLRFNFIDAESAIQAIEKGGRLAKKRCKNSDNKIKPVNQ